MPLFRYHRQELLPGFGPESSAAMARSHAMVIGCGALGTVAAEMLARAGVGRLSLIDRDVVEVTNLQRQTLFDEDDARAARPKAEAAAARLTRVNSSIVIDPIVDDLNPSNADRLVSSHPPPHVLLDCTDNFVARYLLNDLAVKRGIPYIYGGAVATQGMAMTVIPGSTPCLRCIFEEPPPPGTAATCDTAGVFGPIISIIAACEAADALRLLLGQHAAVGNTLLDVELSVNRIRRTDVSRARRDDCPCCIHRKFDFLDGNHESGVESLCGQNAVQVAAPRDSAGLDLASIKSRLDAHGSFAAISTLLVRGTLRNEKGESGDPISLTVFADGRAIVKGTHRPELARSIYSRYVGS